MIMDEQVYINHSWVDTITLVDDPPFEKHYRLLLTSKELVFERDGAVDHIKVEEIKKVIVGSTVFYKTVTFYLIVILVTFFSHQFFGSYILDIVALVVASAFGMIHTDSVLFFKIYLHDGKVISYHDIDGRQGCKSGANCPALVYKLKCMAEECDICCRPN